MRFQVGDILKTPRSNWRYRVSTIENNEYSFDYVTAEGEVWRPALGTYSDNDVHYFELHEPAIPRQEYSFFCIIYRNDNGTLGRLTYDSQLAAERARDNLRNQGRLEVVALKKIKTRI